MQAELEQYLHQHIPLSAAMAVSVVSVNEQEVTLSAPIEPNINHRETVFGGSASALAILSAWSLLHVRLTRLGINSRLVIQRNSVEYEQPILGEFSASARLAQPDQWPRFLRMLQRMGKARIEVVSLLGCKQATVGSFSGEFVALG